MSNIQKLITSNTGIVFMCVVIQHRFSDMAEAVDCFLNKEFECFTTGELISIHSRLQDIFVDLHRNYNEGNIKIATELVDFIEELNEHICTL